MLCRASVELMSLRLDGMLGPDDIAKLEQHLSSCADCRAEYLLMREADNLLRTSARRPLAPPVDFSARVMQRVAATPVQRPGHWERERARIEGGRRTVRLNPTAPINGQVVPMPIGAWTSSQPHAEPAPGFLQGLLRGASLRAVVGGLSAAGVFSVLILGLLSWLWTAGYVTPPAALDTIAASSRPDTVLVSVTSLWRLIEGVVLQINPWLVSLFGVMTIVLSYLWWRTVRWYIRSGSGTKEIAA